MSLSFMTKQSMKCPFRKPDQLISIVWQTNSKVNAPKYVQHLDLYTSTEQ